MGNSSSKKDSKKKRLQKAIIEGKEKATKTPDDVEKKDTKRRNGFSVLCEPTGLYESCAWSNRAVARLVEKKKIAPRYKGSEEELSAGSMECPICFLNYVEVNHLACCKTEICTECYLQIKHPSKESSCPYCGSSSLTAVYKPGGGKSSEAFSTPDRTRSISNSTVSECTPDSSKKSTTPLSSSPVVSSISERQQLEQAMQSQRSSVDSMCSSSSGIAYRDSGSSSRRTSRNRISRHTGRRSGESSRSRHFGTHAFTSLHGALEQYDEEQLNTFSLAEIEDMMFEEAMRLSMLESETPHDNTGNKNQQSQSMDEEQLMFNFDLVNRGSEEDRQHESLKKADSDDEEQRMLEVALQLSLSLDSQPNTTAREDDSKSSSHPEETSEVIKSCNLKPSSMSKGNCDFECSSPTSRSREGLNSLSPTAKLLVDRINKALEFESETMNVPANANLKNDSDYSDREKLKHEDIDETKIVEADCRTNSKAVSGLSKSENVAKRQFDCEGDSYGQDNTPLEDVKLNTEYSDCNDNMESVDVNNMTVNISLEGDFSNQDNTRLEDVKLNAEDSDSNDDVNSAAMNNMSANISASDTSTNNQGDTLLEDFKPKKKNSDSNDDIVESVDANNIFVNISPGGELNSQDNSRLEYVKSEVSNGNDNVGFVDMNSVSVNISSASDNISEEVKLSADITANQDSIDDNTIHVKISSPGQLHNSESNIN